MEIKSLLKQVPLFLLSALLLLVVAQPAQGSGAVTLSVGSASGSVGDTVSVNIEIIHATGTAGGYIDLGWWFVGDPDPLKLKLVSVSKGAFLANADGSLFEEGDLGELGGGLVIKWETPALDTADSGVVATITYELLEAGETELIFDQNTTSVDAPPGRQYGAPINGKITASLSSDDDKQRAIDLANEAIANLPHASMITLDDKDDVENARYLVGRAKTEHGAVDSDFDNLAKLEAAERRIKELEAGEAPGMPTWVYLVLGALVIVVVILVLILVTGSRRSK